MAMMPAAQQQPAGAGMAPGAGADSEAGDTDDAGQVAELCISVMQDGSLEVYREGGGADGETETPHKKASDIDEALKMVLDMYRELTAGGAQDQMQAGFESP